MVDEVRQFPASVDRLAGDGVGSGDGPRSAAEHADFADLKTIQFTVTGRREPTQNKTLKNPIKSMEVYLLVIILPKMHRILKIFSNQCPPGPLSKI